jgi:predicted GH43/DUF377 family glycosyl hydrolase
MQPFCFAARVLARRYAIINAHSSLENLFPGNMASLSASDSSLLGPLQTPHKSPHLLLAPTFRAGDFDSHGVDVPFVFRSDDGFLMTYVGFDGIGYQTGLASSRDLKSGKA